MTTKRLNWAESLWTLYEENDGGVLIVPDNKENLQYSYTGYPQGCVVYDNLGVSYTKEAWASVVEEQAYQDHYEFWLVDEQNNQCSDRYLRLT